jgi:TPR repeat protein
VMKFKFYDQAGAIQEVSVEDAQAVAWYKEAADQGMSVPALLATRYPTNQEQYGSTFEQFCAGLGLFVRADQGERHSSPDDRRSA